MGRFSNLNKRTFKFTSPESNTITTERMNYAYTISGSRNLAYVSSRIVPDDGKIIYVFKIEQKQPSGGVLRKRCSENIQQIYWRNHTSAWVFSCKFAAYFQNTIS